MAAAVPSAMAAVLAALRAGNAGAAREALGWLRDATDAAAPAPPFPPGSLDQLVAVFQAHSTGQLRHLALEAVYFMLRYGGVAPVRKALANESLIRWGEPPAAAYCQANANGLLQPRRQEQQLALTSMQLHPTRLQGTTGCFYHLPSRLP